MMKAVRHAELEEALRRGAWHIWADCGSLHNDSSIFIPVANDVVKRVLGHLGMHIVCVELDDAIEATLDVLS